MDNELGNTIDLKTIILKTETIQRIVLCDWDDDCFMLESVFETNICTKNGVTIKFDKSDRSLSALDGDLRSLRGHTISFYVSLDGKTVLKQVKLSRHKTSTKIVRGNKKCSWDVNGQSDLEKIEILMFNGVDHRRQLLAFYDVDSRVGNVSRSSINLVEGMTQTQINFKLHDSWKPKVVLFLQFTYGGSYRYTEISDYVEFGKYIF